MLELFEPLQNSSIRAETLADPRHLELSKQLAVNSGMLKPKYAIPAPQPDPRFKLDRNSPSKLSVSVKLRDQSTATNSMPPDAEPLPPAQQCPEGYVKIHVSFPLILIHTAAVEAAAAAAPQDFPDGICGTKCSDLPFRYCTYTWADGCKTETPPLNYSKSSTIAEMCPWTCGTGHALLVAQQQYTASVRLHTHAAMRECQHAAEALGLRGDRVANVFYQFDWGPASPKGCWVAKEGRGQVHYNLARKKTGTLSATGTGLPICRRVGLRSWG